ncbi:MAG: LysM peptidoglycan-binding domain-containing protein [Clostridia bacterium]|nr:LysM peptidoglycan-binding domain-containing protein [Clostridia bacterium]
MKKRYVLKNPKRFFIFCTSVLLLIFTTSFASFVYGYKTPHYEIVEVKQGDTLWKIASEYSGNSDIRKFIHNVKKVNSLDSNSKILAGSELKIPVQ